MANSTSIEEEALQCLQGIVSTSLQERGFDTPVPQLVTEVAESIAGAIRLFRAANLSAVESFPAAPAAGLAEQ